MTGEALCHCGAPVKVHDGGFTRGLCADCDEVRCDVDGSCGAVTGETPSPAQSARVARNSGETPLSPARYEPDLEWLCDDPECCENGCPDVTCKFCHNDWPCPDYRAAHTPAQIARQERWVDRKWGR